MATIELRLSSKEDKETHRSEILIRFYHGKVIDARAGTEIYILPYYWNGKEIEVKDRITTKDTLYHTNAQTQLSNLKSEISTKFQTADKKTIGKGWLDAVIDKYLHPAKYEIKEVEVKPLTLFEYIEQFIAKAPERRDKLTGRLLSRNNLQQYNATHKHLKAFADSLGLNDFEFLSVNADFYTAFIAYLQGLGFTANSIGKHIRILKLMLNEAPRELRESAEYDSFRVFTEEVDNIYLDEKELEAIKNTDFTETPYLDRTRDWFLLLAWTGCRFSDLEKITKNNIKDGNIVFRQQKTGTKVYVPLHPIVEEILKKHDYNMPEAISNQRFNEYVKEVAKLAGIEGIESITRTEGGVTKTTTYPKYELVSSHTGRRSFATNMYRRGLPTLMIMSITGHQTEKSFLKYVKITAKEHAEMMKKQWDKIYGGKEE